MLSMSVKSRAITKLLIANRGEIAVRIMRTAKRMGIATVAVFSDPDRRALHVDMADEAIAIGGCTPLESYLSIEKILTACRRAGADAVHPGYGFLSENAEFARACSKAGIRFVGPSPEAIDAMGNKSRAKELMHAAGVPVLPGYQGQEQSLGFLADRAEEIGFPVMIKAAAGGGGRGLRLASTPGELHDLLTAARAESERAFGSGELLLERALSGARHVEVQVFGDTHGNVIHLGERDCSIQRRHQKVLEESPCPQVSASLRDEMGSCAVRAAKAINYVGAGTIEFLLDKDDRFYFLEMNTRLQVEHPVTESITALDLVEWQLRVANGEPLPLSQADVSLQGHAIEARLYAEDPDDQFRPQVGEILKFCAPTDQWLRVDHGLNQIDAVSPYYDAMLAKIIAVGENRDAARRRLQQALQNLVIFGVKTNRRFLLDCISKPAYVSGDFDTGFIEKNFAGPAGAPGKGGHELKAALIAAAILVLNGTGNKKRFGDDELFGWASNADMHTLMRLSLNGKSILPLALRFAGDHQAGRQPLRLIFSASSSERLPTTTTVNLEGEHVLEVVSITDGVIKCLLDDELHSANYVMDGDAVHVSIAGADLVARDVLFSSSRTTDTVSDGNMIAPSNGLIVSMNVQVGDEVVIGTPLFTLEAMKLLQTISAPVSGRIASVFARAGQQVKAKQLIIQIAGAEPDADAGEANSKGTREFSKALI